MAGRFDVRRERSWSEQNEDNYWSSNVRRDDRRDDRGRDDRGREDRGRDEGSRRRDRDEYGQGPVDSWGRHHDYDDSFDRTWHGAHGADREYHGRREDLSRDRRDWERYNDMDRSRMNEDRARWDQRFNDDRRWQPSRGGDHYDRRGEFQHGREIPRASDRDRRNSPHGDERYRGDERLRGDERWRGDERSRGDERFRGAELRSYDRMREDDRRDGRHWSDNNRSDNNRSDNGRSDAHWSDRGHNDGGRSEWRERDLRDGRPGGDRTAEGERKSGNTLTWRDFDRWSDDRIEDSRGRGIGFNRGDDYHDRFWSTGDRHRDAW